MNEYQKYIVLKSAIEDLFGSDAWYALKESNSISVWRKYITKTLKAIQLSLLETVKVYDRDWLSNIDHDIDRGITLVKSITEIDELIAVLAGILIRVSFQQVGMMPSRKGSREKFPLRKGSWELSEYRSVQYVQCEEQRERMFWSKQQREIGFQKQMDLWSEYRKSGSKHSFSDWCKEY